jgi:3-hydroxyacyl-CoA dehydrogenase
MNELTIRRVTVLGAGREGGALATHLTNLGFSVSLLDASPQLAAEGMEAARFSLYVPERAGEVRVAALGDPASGLEESDWVIDAFPDRFQTKQEMYAAVAPQLRPDAVITTCSSSLPVSELAKALPESIASRFLAASFALPIAERALVEVRSGPSTNPNLTTAFTRFLLDSVARRPIALRDNPAGLIARYGVWCLCLAAHVGEKLRLDIEDVDAITTLFLGQPLFQAIDAYGLDEIRDVAANLQAGLPQDRGIRYLTLPNSFVGLLARGWTGDRAGRGFYRREGRDRLALNLTTMAYRQAKDSSLYGLQTAAALPEDGRLRTALSSRDEVGEFLREFLIPCLRYAEYLRAETQISVLDFDRTMEWGFGWDRGPFSLLDNAGLGANPYYKGKAFLSAPETYVPIAQDEVCQSVEECPLIEKIEHFAIHDLGDGIQAVALSAGSLTPGLVAALVGLLEHGAVTRFVLTSSGENFPSLDFPLLYDALRTGNTLAADAYLASLQTLGELLESKPCVFAISGRCVGAALGLALSCPAIVAVATAEVGFNEPRMGILPTARALALMRRMHGDTTRRLGEVALTLAEGIVATNADLARFSGLLRPTDLTEYLPERLLTTAKRVAQTVVPGPSGSFPLPEGPLVGIIDRGLADRRARGGLTDHDVAVGQRIRQVIARTASYEECLDRERSETVDMGSKALTLARLRHMIEVGKPLRN